MGQVYIYNIIKLFFNKLPKRFTTIFCVAILTLTATSFFFNMPLRLGDYITKKKSSNEISDAPNKVNIQGAIVTRTAADSLAQDKRNIQVENSPGTVIGSGNKVTTTVKNND